MSVRKEVAVVAVVLAVGYSIYGGAFLLAAGSVGGGDPAPANEDGNDTPGGRFADQPPFAFENATAEAGLDYEYTPTRGMMSDAGVFVTDFDNDDWPDVLAVGGERPVLFENAGGTFERSGALPEIEGAVRAALFFDADGDGWEDLLLLRTHGEALFLENQQGTFERREDAFDATLDVPIGATAGDYDGDGCLDVFVIQNGDWADRRPNGMRNYSIPASYDNGNPNLLFRGDCSGSFENVTSEADVTGTHWSLATSFVDLTGDGRPDIHVANDFFHDALYVNQGDGTFEKRWLSNATNRNGMSSEVADVNRDGRPDLFVTNIYFTRELQPAMNFTAPIRARGNNLLVNQGNGTFEERAEEYGVQQGGWGWAAVLADFDNDMDRDLFHTTRRFAFTSSGIELNDEEKEDLFFLHPYYRYPTIRERDGGTFHEVMTERVVPGKSDARGVAQLDYDRDGSLDLLLATTSGRYRLYDNTGTSRGAIQVAVQGDGNATAMGAAVSVTVGNRTQSAARIAGSDYLSQDSRVLHFGVGNNTRADVRVVWPDDTVRTFENVAAGQRLVVSPTGVVRRVPLDGDASAAGRDD